MVMASGHPPSVPPSAMGQTGRVDDLHVPPGPGAPRGMTVPEEELVEQFSRSSGPGGQGVNTADSRVQLSLDLGTTTALSDAQRARALHRLAERLTGTVLTVTASENRSQRRNRAAARQRPPARCRHPSGPATGDEAHPWLTASSARGQAPAFRGQAKSSASASRLRCGHGSQCRGAVAVSRRWRTPPPASRAPVRPARWPHGVPGGASTRSLTGGRLP